MTGGYIPDIGTFSISEAQVPGLCVLVFRAVVLTCDVAINANPTKIPGYSNIADGPRNLVMLLLPVWSAIITRNSLSLY